MKKGAPLLAIAACAGTLALAAPADAAFDSCAYDSAARTATVSLAGPGDGQLSVGAGGQILADGTPCGAATTANTDRVDGGVADADYTYTNSVTIDESGPGGSFAKPGTDDEVAIDLDLGDYSECFEFGCKADPQLVKIVGTPGADDIRVGLDDGALVANLDASSDLDTDVRVRGHGLRPELDGGPGADTLTGLGGPGAGIDPVTVTLRGGPDGDRLAAGGYDDVIYPGGGDDTVNASPYGQDVVSYEDAPSGVTASLDTAVVDDDGFGGRDHLDRRDLQILHGSEHADDLTGISSRPSTIDGRGGDDFVVGGYAADHLLGGEGADRLWGSEWVTYDGDQIAGGPGDDTLRGSWGKDTLEGGLGDDTIYGSRGKLPTTVKFYDNDNDRLIGGPGNDVLAGGHSSDVYLFEYPAEREVDTIDEATRQGSDTLWISYDLYYRGRPLVTTHLNLSSRIRKFGKSGLRSFRTSRPGAVRYVENVTAGDMGPLTFRLVGNDADNVFSIGEPSDKSTADCRGGRDTVHGVALAKTKNCESVD